MTTTTEKETPVSAPTSHPTSETTGIRSLIATLDAVAAAHAAVANGEGFLASLNRMEVGQEDQQRYLAAQEASRLAEQAWKQAADSVRRHNDPVGEAYRQNPGAANKQANTNE